VAAVAIGITALATFVPAWRAARTSTVRALAGGAHPPRRRQTVVNLSRHLPVTLLIGLRIAARRPRRTLLGAFTIAVAVIGVITVMYAQATLNSDQPGSPIGLPDPNTQRLSEVMLALTILLTIMTAVNLIFITSITALDAKISLAVTGALGATPAQATGGLAAAQIIPALLGAVSGWPAGAALFAALDNGADSAAPPLWRLIVIIPATVLLTAALTALPAQLATRRPIAATLSSGSS
jgi:putative ABC transport system permease protein